MNGWMWGKSVCVVKSEMDPCPFWLGRQASDAMYYLSFYAYGKSKFHRHKRGNAPLTAARTHCTEKNFLGGASVHFKVVYVNPSEEGVSLTNSSLLLLLYAASGSVHVTHSRRALHLSTSFRYVLKWHLPWWWCLSAIHWPSLTLMSHLRPRLDFRYGMAICTTREWLDAFFHVMEMCILSSVVIFSA